MDKMAQTDIDAVKTKLNEVKQQSEDIRCLYSAFIDTVTVAIDKANRHTESTNIAGIQAKLDAVSGVLSEQFEESSRLMTEVSVPCDHKPEDSRTTTLLPEPQNVPPSQDSCENGRITKLAAPCDHQPEDSTACTMSPECQIVLSSQDSSQSGLMTELAATCGHQPEESTAHTLLPESQIVLPSQNSSQSDLAQFAFRLKALETAVSELTASVRENTLHQQAAKAEQDNAIQTTAETLTSLISCEIDSLDVKLQQMILNCSDKLDFQGWGIRTINNQISSVQTAFSDVHLWKQMTSELTSRLYTLEDTTNRFIKKQESEVNTKPPTQINDTCVKDDNDMGVKGDNDMGVKGDK